MKNTKLKSEQSLANPKLDSTKDGIKTQPHMDGEEFLADTPEKPSSSKEPNNQHLDGEDFLSNTKHIKSFESFVNENYNK